jgi:hypothetical protein
MSDHAEQAHGAGIVVTNPDRQDTETLQSLEQEEVTEAPPERLGNYTVHPVAAMFPLLQGELYERFKGNIRANGQIEPIIVQGDVLIDGRNRLRACLDLGIKPLIEEYSPKMDACDRPIDVARYILAKNLERRDLTRDQRVMIAAQVHAWAIADRARLRKIEGGKEGGRGKKKNPNTNRYEGFEEPKTRAQNARERCARE